jgi:uncharacterized membrane protein YbhN (UPF0104 family)
MRPRTVTLLTIPAAVLVFAASVYYLSTHFRWREAFDVLLKADFVKLAVLIGLSHFAYIVVRAWRWHVAVQDAVPGVSLLDCYWITAIAVSLSVVTPGQLGEALKIELMKRRGLGRLPGAGAFALERLLDLIVVSSMAAAGILLGRFSRIYRGVQAGAVFLIVLAFACLYILLRFNPGGRISVWLARLRRASTSPKNWAVMALLTVLSWTLVGIGWSFALGGVQIHLAVPEVLTLVSLVTVGYLLSFVPGGLGVSEVVTTAILTNMGVAVVTAQAGALVLRAYTLLIFLFGSAHLALWPIFGTHSRRRIHRRAGDGYSEKSSLASEL